MLYVFLKVLQHLLDIITPSKGPGVPENTESEPKDLTVCLRLEIVESNYSSEDINIVLKGYIMLHMIFI